MLLKLCLVSGLENGGKDCWHKCNYKKGKCKWCGTDGLCCRKSWTGSGCDGTFGGLNKHQCVLKPSGMFLRLQNNKIKENSKEWSHT